MAVRKKKSQIYALHKPVYTREFNYLITKLPEISSVLLYYDDQQLFFQNTTLIQTPEYMHTPHTS